MISLAALYLVQLGYCGDCDVSLFFRDYNMAIPAMLVFVRLSRSILLHVECGGARYQR